MTFVRTFLITTLLVGGFLYLTHDTPWSPRHWLSPEARSTSAERLWSSPSVAQSAGLSADELNNIEIYERAHRATVNITTVTYRQDWFFNVVPQQGSGSGFLIDDQGRILTNNHVVQDGNELTVTLSDRSSYKAKLLVRDPGNDLALIQISPRKKVPFLPLGNSEKLMVGQKVLAIGNPFGLEGTLTTGIISALGRSIRGEGEAALEDMIQTDAAINRGNSGGPLLDSQGNVIGINTAILGANNIGIGFAMPVRRAKIMLDEFAQKGRFAPASIGVNATYIPPEWAEALRLPPEGGLLITRVLPGSAAEQAGLRGATRMVLVGPYEIPFGGDYIMAIDGEPVESDSSLRAFMARKRPGDTVRLTIFREGRSRQVTVTLGEGRTR
jgi:S1-C subfamily serine protease